MRLYDWLNHKEELTDKAIRLIETTDQVAEKDLGDFKTAKDVNDFAEEFYKE